MCARIRDLSFQPSAEQLFLLGGELMQPYFPQAGHDPEHDKKFPVAYVVEDASIDEMSFSGEIVGLTTYNVFAHRLIIDGRVRKHISMADNIESSRIALANKVREMYRPYSLDP